MRRKIIARDLIIGADGRHYAFALNEPKNATERDFVGFEADLSPKTTKPRPFARLGENENRGANPRPQNAAQTAAQNTTRNATQNQPNSNLPARKPQPTKPRTQPQIYHLCHKSNSKSTSP